MDGHNPYAPPTARPPTKKVATRATLVLFWVGVLMLFISALWTVVSLAALIALTSVQRRHQMTPGQLNANGAVATICAGLPIAWMLSAGVGLINSRRWAWLLALGYFALALPLAVLGIGNSREPGVTLFFASIFGIACVVLLLLLLPAVRKHFARGA